MTRSIASPRRAECARGWAVERRRGELSITGSALGGVCFRHADGTAYGQAPDPRTVELWSRHPCGQSRAAIGTSVILADAPFANQILDAPRDTRAPGLSHCSRPGIYDPCLDHSRERKPSTFSER
jgi:hypothetical protein